MYDLKIFDSINLDIDWFCIYYGVKNNILKQEVIAEFSTRKLEHTDISKYELELAYGEYDSHDTFEILEKIIDVNSEERMLIAKEKVRVAILSDLRAKMECVETFFQEVENVYSNFDYPSDMEKFIYYMPANENCIDSFKLANQERMLKEFDFFIAKKLEKYRARA